MRFVIAGSSGFLGTALRDSLAGDGHEVVRLVRRSPEPGESQWDPYSGTVDQHLIDSADVVVNLAGSPTAGNPHSKKWARNLLVSRVTTTQVLAEAIARSHNEGTGSPAFLAGSAVATYGDHGDALLDESADSVGDTMMTNVVREWEAAAAAAHWAGARVCKLRTAPVIDRASEPLKQMIPAFKVGLGVRLGDGHQYFPVISLRDWVGAVTHLATAETAGPVNLCCPITPTNAEFTDALAEALGRRARLAVPARVLKVAAGALAPELLGSMRLRPAALLGSNYTFHDTDVRDVIAAGLKS